MKKFTKRSVAIVLAIVMLIGLLAVGAGAATYTVKSVKLIALRTLHINFL